MDIGLYTPDSFSAAKQVQLETNPEQIVPGKLDFTVVCR